MLNAIIFDMDGVLFDSQPLHFAAEIETVEHFNGKITIAELKQYLGWTETAFWNDVVRRYHLKATPEQCEKFKRPLFRDLLDNALSPDHSLQDLLSELRGKGRKLAVASSSKRIVIDKILGSLGVSGYFDAIVSADDVMRSKPAPDIFLAAAKKIKAAPEDCVVVEDAPAGIEAAISAGMYPIAMRNKSNEGLDLSKAKKIITGLYELKGLE
jgi:beta-phosphoglucomutase